MRGYPDLDGIFPAAAGCSAPRSTSSALRRTADDQRPWLRHAGWPADSSRCDATRPLGGGAARPVDDYAFVRVEGEGVHEIPVGPVHAGIIEPGHFRFSRWSAKRCCGSRSGWATCTRASRSGSNRCPSREGTSARGACRAISTVAYSWAYCQALEAIGVRTVPPRAAWLRALALERERIANHLGDLGLLGNDAGFAFGLAQFSRLKEDWLRANAGAVRAALPDGRVVPGGVARDMSRRKARAHRTRPQQLALARRSALLREIYDEHAGLRDRFRAAGSVTPELAARLGLVGLAGRASGQAFDLRSDPPLRSYAELGVRRAGTTTAMSLRASRCASTSSSNRSPGRAIDRRELPAPDSPARSASRWLRRPYRLGVGVVEGWRGPVLVALEAGRTASSAVIRTTRRGRTGRCSSTRSSATSFRTSR